ncbi:hypothetical protein NLU13_7042 [Sarocladium strictum]|uniref:Uncharacterized protein n=1 Tax=Sarocladium strictum TaxID=5046 RepID=A0AA39L6K6_SARSR|nr:hypothetical protein NLU13_7042 [Sarocladium strictum]
MKYSRILPSISLLPSLVSSRTFIGSLYENPDACEYTDEYSDGHACDNLDIGSCCFKEGSLWGSGEIVTEDVGNPSDYLAPIRTKRGEVDDDHPASSVYCGPAITTVTLNNCGVGGNLQVIGGVSFEAARVMDQPTKEEQAGDDTRRDEVTQGEASKDRAPEAREFKPPMKGVQAEMAMFGPDYIYIISDARVAELEAQGLGRPDNKEERIEWFKKYHTVKRKNTGPRLARRVE